MTAATATAQPDHATPDAALALADAIDASLPLLSTYRSTPHIVALMRVAARRLAPACLAVLKEDEAETTALVRESGGC
jgi:hypothetical protein